VKLKVSTAKAKSSLKKTFKPFKVNNVVLEGDKNALKALKSGKNVYLYVKDDGDFGLAGIFTKEPGSELYDKPGSDAFRTEAKYLYTVSGLDGLKGIRIRPSFIEITKTKIGEGKVEVSGMLYDGYDPVLPYLDHTDKTEYGTGTFNPEDVRALYDGTYFYAPLSPNAKELDIIANEQKTYFEALKTASNAGEIYDAKQGFLKTTNLLKPHAYEVFRKDNDLIYYVTKAGKWVAINITGNRALDALDRERLAKILEEEGLTGEAAKKIIRYSKQSYGKKNLRDRQDLKAILPLLTEEIERKKADDKKELELRGHGKAVSHTELEAIPGLKEGVEFPPHQVFMLNHIKDQDRMLVDADPGAGKTLVIIADILYQMSKGKIKRPLVIVPNSLASQFASEVQKFSELNPWIITTESINSWKKGDTTDFFQDALDAPDNTIFITSYNWISGKPEHVDAGNYNVEGELEHGVSKVFKRSYQLLNDLEIDYVAADEVHLLKNESNISHATSVFSKAKQIKGFTGTVMPGNLIDVLGPMGFIHSAVFGTASDFLDKHSPTKTINSYYDNTPKEIRAKLQKYGVPQVRSTAWAQLLPPTHRQYHYVNFNNNQEKAYDSLLNSTITEIEKDPKLLKMFNRFRASLRDDEVIIHPMLLARFNALEVFLNSPAKASSYLQAILSGDDAKSPKVGKINEIASQHLSNPDNGKVLIFCQYIESAKAIFENLDPHLKQQAAFYRGGMVEVLNSFKNPSSDLKILIGVDKTIRVGHNLQIANCIIHADTLWLPGDMRQREARSARIKQTRPVFIHHVIVRNSNELLKNARNLAQEHIIAKANSDFDEKDVLEQVTMTLKDMRSFRNLTQIEPYITRQKSLEAFRKKQGELDKDKFGSRSIKPTSYPTLNKGTKLAVVPSTSAFVGNSNDVEFQIEEELNSLPDNPTPPTILKFNFQNWDEQWLLTVFKAGDIQGFVRKLGFLLQPPYMYRELQNKNQLSSTIDDIEDAGIEILHKDKLLTQTARIRTTPGHRGILKELEQESRKVVAAVTTQMEFHFGTIDGYPFVYSDSLKLGSEDSKKLKRIQFKEGLSFWYLPLTRNRLIQLLKRLQTQFKDVKIAEWDEFKEQVNIIFRINLKDFDDIGEVPK